MTRCAAPIAEQIWDMKYRFKGFDSTPVDVTVEDTWNRIAAGLEAAKPGNTTGDIAVAFFKVLEKFGIHKDSRCGYPIGISYPPDWGERTMSLRPGDTSVLQPGMTFHFMPGLWMDDWGLEITESILITETGVETLCNVPRQLFVKD